MAADKPDSFQCGPFEVARNPDVRQFVDKLNRLREEVDKNRLQPGVGYDISRSSGGTTLSIRARGGSGSVAPGIHPFKIYAKMQDKTLRVRVQDQSFVTPGTFFYPPENAGQWIDTGQDGKTPVKIWLTAGVFQYALDPSKKILIAAGGNRILTEPSAGEGQTSVNLLLGTASSTEIVQAVNTNVISISACVDGKPALLLVPFAKY